MHLITPSFYEDSSPLQLRLVADSDEMLESSIAKYLLKNPTDARGTVEATAQAWDEALLDGKCSHNLFIMPLNKHSIEKTHNYSRASYQCAQINTTDSRPCNT
jgi:hypothetical protein